MSRPKLPTLTISLLLDIQFEYADIWTGDCDQICEAGGRGRSPQLANKWELIIFSLSLSFKLIWTTVSLFFVHFCFVLETVAA